MINENMINENMLNENMINENIINEIEQYSIKISAEHYFEPAGIHGIEHTKRVLLLSAILADLNALSLTEKDILYHAAVYHDIGRTCNGIDHSHGLKSWRKVKDLGILAERNEEFEQILKYVITNHSISDVEVKEFIGSCENIRVKLLFELLKDSDGLDRVRLGDLDVNYLRNGHSKGLVEVARSIYKKD